MKEKFNLATSKTEKNVIIVDMIHQKLAELGISNELDVCPIPNTCLRRNRNFKSKGKNFFSIHMWTVNSEPYEEVEKVIDSRIKEARNYFQI